MRSRPTRSRSLVALDIVESLPRPGANFTGVIYSDAVLGGKRLEFLIDALPGTKRVAVLWSRLNPENAPLYDNITRSASTRGIEIVSRELHGAEDLAPAFGDAARAGAQCVIFLTDLGVEVDDALEIAEKIEV